NVRLSRNGGEVAPAIENSVAPAPEFSREVHPVFCEGGASKAEGLDLSGIFAEADAQRRGAYRFAGGRCDRFDPETVEMRADSEDVHSFHRLYWARRYAIAAAFGHEGARESLLAD